MSNDDFDNVPVGSNQENGASPPDPGFDWRGVVIRLPTTAYVERSGDDWARLPPIPLCGFYRLDMLDLPADGLLVVVAVNAADGTQLRGVVGDEDEDPGTIVPPPHDPPLPDAMLEGVSTDEYFNPDLTRTVGLPARPGIWVIHVRFGHARSNDATIEIVEKPRGHR
jgi:hypothetical protein